MPRLLAVDWDHSEVRYVLADARGGRLRIVAAAAKELPSTEDQDEPRRTEIAQWLKQQLAGRRKGRTETLVGLDRASLELLHLTLPPARDDELPELVRNQAMRESALVSDDSLLDFVPLNTESGERVATAMALSHAEYDKIVATCQEAGITPKRLLVRPYATASLLARRPSLDGPPCLLVNRFAVDADLTVVADGRVTFWRTVRLPSGGEEDAVTDALTAEISRTLMIAQNQVGTAPVQRVVLLGSNVEHQGLVNRIVEQLSLEAVVVDPFREVDELDTSIPDAPGRYSALLGMLLDETQGHDPVVDLLHPRRKPEPPNRRRLVTIGLGLAAVILVGLGYQAMNMFTRLDDQIQALDVRMKDLKEKEKQSAKQKQSMKAIRDWKSGDAVLLDELRDLSLRLPDSRDMMVVQLSKSTSRNGWCVINLKGLVRDPLVVSRMERNLHDEYHEVRSPRGQGQRPGEDYTWRFESSITIAKRSKEDYLEYLHGRRPGTMKVTPTERTPPDKKETGSTSGVGSNPAD
ncbi:MAG: hypothetical protein ACC645_06550 [Pirellulales bacterium]